MGRLHLYLTGRLSRLRLLIKRGVSDLYSMQEVIAGGGSQGVSPVGRQTHAPAAWRTCLQRPSPDAKVAEGVSCA